MRRVVGCEARATGSGGDWRPVDVHSLSERCGRGGGVQEAAYEVL